MDKKLITYNCSHHKVGPGSYSSHIGTIGGKFILKANWFNQINLKYLIIL